MRPVLVPALAFLAACTSFSAGPATETPAPGDVDAGPSLDGALPEGAAHDDAPARFCAGHAAALLCEDFEDGYAQAWGSLPREATGEPSMMRRAFEGGAHGTVARIDAPAEPDHEDDNADLRAGNPEGTYALSFSLRVDQIADDQYVEVTSIKTQNGSKAAFHIELQGQSVRLNEFIEDASHRTQLGHVDLGQWHRVEVEVTFGPENRIAAGLDGARIGPQLWADNHTETITGDVRVIAGLHFLSEWKAPFRYAIDDIVLTKKP